MTAYLDTNILVRHFTGDPPAQARAATRLLASTTDLRLTDVVAAETVYVLESFYKRSPAEAAMLVRAVTAFASVRSEDEHRLLRALELHELYRIDFTDCYLAACAEGTAEREVASFDHDLDKVTGITRLKPEDAL